MRPTATALSVLTICGLLLGACAGAPPRLNPPGPTPVVTAPVLAPAPRTIFIRPPPPPPAAKASCVPRGFPHAPRYPDTDAALRDAGGAADRYQLMAAGRILRTLRLAELEKIIEGCR